MDCIICDNDNLRDYPVCLTCEPFSHFTHRGDCRCDSCAPLSLLHLRYEFAPVGSARAADLAILINQRNTVAPVIWCEPCFSSKCQHAATEELIAA